MAFCLVKKGREGVMLEHLSASQLTTFQMCGEKYRRRYIDGERAPSSIEAHIGKSVHKSVEVNFKSKVLSGEDLPLDAVQDAAAENYDKSLSSGVFVPPDELPGAKLAMAAGKDITVDLATLYRSGIAPKIQPVLVEERISIDLSGVELPVITVLDCYATDAVLHETKTSAKKWNEERVQASPQPPLYREAVNQITGSYPEKTVFDVLVKTKEPSAQQLEYVHGEEDLPILAKKFNLMLASIKAGIFLPAQPDHWCCSPKYCEFYFTCPHIPAHRKILPKRSS